MTSRRLLAVTLALAGCLSSEPATSTQTSGVSGTNGIFQNGLATNGIWQNGIWQNGIWQNGIWQNGIWQNGIWQNGIWQNGIWQNGIWQNGIWQNGIWQNGIWQNGIWQNGIWQNGIWQNGIWQNGAWLGNTSALTVLQQNPYARRVLQYMYACAMPAGAHKTFDAGDGTTFDLDGAIGLAPQWDVDGGACDESCQRWVTACVLARTNAYGFKVDISMRAPADAPDAIKAALAVTDDEKATYTLREGAFYGNMFQTTPTTPVGVDGPVVNTPTFYACAGPGSNIPELTKRFCSSQGDDGPINVVGVCLPTAADAGSTCAGIDDETNGAVSDCFTGASQTGTEFKEVITVYLKQPFGVCGDAVCDRSETADSCPSDCHPGTWARAFDGTPLSGSSTVGPDGSVVVVGQTDNTRTIDLGGGPIPPSEAPRQLVVAKFAPDGSWMWGRRLDANDAGSIYAVAIAEDGTVGLAAPTFQSGVWLAELDADTGALESGWPVRLGGPAQLGGGVTGQSPQNALAFDGGNLVVAGTYQGVASFGPFTLTSTDYDGVIGSCCSQLDVFVAKVTGGGEVQWATSLGTEGSETLEQLAVDGAGNVIVTMNSLGDTLVELASADGAKRWSRGQGMYGAFIGVGADPMTGDVYVSGRFGATVDFGNGPVTAPTPFAPNSFFVASYTQNGSFRWVRMATDVEPANFGPRMLAIGAHLSVDALGNVIVGGVFGNAFGGDGAALDFGAGPFYTFRSQDVFVVSYSGDGDFLWAKQVPMVLDSTFLSLTQAGAHVVLSGGFSGSMQVDDRLLVNAIPEQPNHRDMFVASFGEPPAFDDVPPVVENTSLSFTVQATGSSGAPVWFAAPTAVDNANAGTTVSCNPPPNSTFAVGTTTVTCTGFNPAGNRTTSQFTVTVVDIVPPVMVNTPTAVTVEATGPSGAVATYTPPTAEDRVSGAAAVTCTPSGGGTFPVGTTPVLCEATDASGNKTQTTFGIFIVDTTPPAITAPASVTATGATATFTVTATDLVDGTVPVACVPASGSTFPVGTTTVTCSAHDAAGNLATASFPVTRAGDTTPPALTVPSPIIAEATGPAGAGVSFAATAIDAVDPHPTVTCAPSSGSTFPLATTTVTCTARDASGNTATGSFTVRIADTTPPAVTVPAPIAVNATGGSGAVVTFAASATDVVDGARPRTCAPASGSTFAIGTTTVTCSATDTHGNPGTNHFTITVANTAPPVLTVPTSVAATATSATGAAVSYAASATDGTGHAITPSCSKASGSAFALGTTTVTCTATDALGNHTTKSFPVAVTLAWSGILQPINTDGSSIFLLGSTVRARFRLIDASAPITNLAPTITITRTSSSVAGSRLEFPWVLPATPGTTFRYNPLTHRYYFNVPTSSLSSGTYSVKIDLHDGVTHTAQFSVKTFTCGACEQDNDND